MRRWADSQGYGDCEIKTIALEGEGKIVDRAESLWRLLLAEADHLRAADVIVLGRLLEDAPPPLPGGSKPGLRYHGPYQTNANSERPSACHSQGVPVGVMLVAKLLESGIIGSPRIGICAMGRCGRWTAREFG